MNKNKTLRVATSLMLVASTASVAAVPVQTEAANKPTLKSKFSDVNKGDYFHDAVVTLTEERVLNGYGDQTFRPNVPTTRGHIAIILTRTLGLQASQYVNIQDMPTSHDTYEYAAAVIDRGFMTTDEYNNFNPKSELSRYEYAEILVRAYNLAPTYKKKHNFKNVPKRYEKAVQTVFDHGLMRGVSTTDFGGYEHVTRGQMAVTLINARNLGQEVDASEPVFAGMQTTEIINYNTRTNKLVTTDGEFKIHPNLKPLFTNSNKEVLQNAVIDGEFAGDELIAIENIEILQPAFASNQTIAEWKANAIASIDPNVAAPNSVYASTSLVVLDLGGLTIPGTITLKRSSVSIRNGVVGRIIVTDEADTALYLEKLTVKNLIVHEGYYRTFLLQLKDSVANRVEIDRDGVVLKSNNKLAQLIISDNVYFIDLQTAIGLLQAVKEGYLTLYGLISIDRLLVAEDTDVHIGSTGYVKEAELLARNAYLSFVRNLRLGIVTVPDADYTKFLDGVGDLKQHIAKVRVPGSDTNLFHHYIDLPTKEELQREELFANLVDEVSAEGSRNQFSFISSINSYAASMRDYPVNLSFVVTSGLAQHNDTDVIKTTVTFRGKTTEHNFTVAQLRSGFSLGSMTLKDLAPNNDNRVNIEFETPFPFSVRGSLNINGVPKGSAEAQLNTQYAEDMKLLISGITSSPIPGGVEVEKRYGVIGEAFNNMPEDMKLYLTELNKPEDETLTVPMKVTYMMGDVQKTTPVQNIKLSDLKAGISLYELVGLADKKLLKENGRKIEKWTVEFSDTIDAEFKVVSTVNKEEVKVHTFTVNYELEAEKAISNFYASGDSRTGKVSLTKLYGSRIDTSLLNKVQDVRLQLTTPNQPTSGPVPFTIKYKLANGQEETKEITNVSIGDLVSGVSLYSLLGKGEQILTAGLANARESFEIKFANDFVGELRFTAIIGSNLEASANYTMNYTVAAPKALKSFTQTDVKNGFKIEKTYNDLIPTSLIGQSDDVKLTMLQDLANPKMKDDDKLPLTIKYRFDNGTEETKTVSDKTVKELKAGVSLYTLLGREIGHLTASKVNKVESFEVVFTNELHAQFKAEAVIAGKSEDARTFTIKPPTYVEHATASFTADVTPKTSPDTIIVKKTYTQFVAGMVGKGHDIQLKATNISHPTADTDKVSLEITYTKIDNKTEKKNITVSVNDLKAGKSLYDLLGISAEKLTEDHRLKTEQFAIKFTGEFAGSFTLTSTVEGEAEPHTKTASISTVKTSALDTEATKNFTATKTSGDTITVKKEYSDFKEDLKGKTHNIVVKATDLAYPTTADTTKVKLQLVYTKPDGTKTASTPVEITREDLLAGKSLYTLLGDAALPTLTADHRLKWDQFEIKVMSPFEGKLTFTSTVNGEESVSRSVDIDTYEAPEEPAHLKELLISAVDGKGISIEKQYGTTIAGPDLIGKKSDVKLRIPDLKFFQLNSPGSSELTTSTTDTVRIAITVGTADTATVRNVTVDELRKGISLYEHNAEPKLTAELSNQTEEIRVEFLDLVEGEFFVESYLDDATSPDNKDDGYLDLLLDSLYGFNQFNVTTTSDTATMDTVTVSTTSIDSVNIHTDNKSKPLGLHLSLLSTSLANLPTQDSVTIRFKFNGSSFTQSTTFGDLQAGVTLTSADSATLLGNLNTKKAEWELQFEYASNQPVTLDLEAILLIGGRPVYSLEDIEVQTTTANSAGIITAPVFNAANIRDRITSSPSIQTGLQTLMNLNPESSFSRALRKLTNDAGLVITPSRNQPIPPVKSTVNENDMK